MTLSKNIDIDELITLEKELIRIANEVKKHLNKYNINYTKDVRYSIFDNLSSIISSLELYFVLQGNYLLKDEFWTALKNFKNFQ